MTAVCVWIERDREKDKETEADRQIERNPHVREDFMNTLGRELWGEGAEASSATGRQ